MELRAIRPTGVTGNKSIRPGYVCQYPPKYGKLVCACWNVRSLEPKLDEIRIIVKSNSLDVLAINETWLNESYTDSELEIKGFNLIRKDRIGRPGGGVCFYIKEQLKYKVLSDINSGIESLWLEIEGGKDKLILGTIYRPPDTDNRYYESMLDEIEKAKNINENVLLLGDLNFNYKIDETLSKNPIKYIEDIYDMRQLVNSPTRVTMETSSLLDVVLSTFYEKHTNTKVLKNSLSDHYCVITTISTVIGNSKNKHRVTTFRDYKNFDSDRFLEDLRKNIRIKDNCEYSNETDTEWEQFRRSFIDISNKHAPLITRRLKQRCNPWIDSNVVKLMYKRDYIKRKATKLKSKTLWIEYKKLRNQVTSLCKEKKKQYVSKHTNECGNDSKKLWKFINKLTKAKDKNSVSSSISANKFNDFFTEIGPEIANKLTTTTDEIPWKGLMSKTSFKFKEIKCEDIEKLLQRIGSDSNNDVLGFDAKLLNLSCKIISPILYSLYNKSMFNSNVAIDWKLAGVMPGYKGKGDKDDPTNYRPISVIGHIPKILERLVQKQLLKYLSENNYISLDQSAYRQNHNTQTSLHRVVDDWIDNMCDNMYTGVCFLDIKKCFDTIDHNVLLEKMKYYGIDNSELKWFKSYLEDRSQIVKCNGQTSERKFVSIGVPQGSVLGPLLFLMFVNDLSQHTHIGVTNLYADDTVVYYAGKTVDEVNSVLQQCVTDMSKWYGGNKLTLNAEKSNTMIIRTRFRPLQDNDKLNISINGTCLKQVNSTRYLGTIIDEHLTWNEQVGALCRSLSYKVSQLARLKKSTPNDIIIRIYNSVIQPCFDYAVTIWGNSTKSNISKIQRIQNRAARIITGNFDYVNHRGIDIVHNLGWMDIEQRIMYFRSLLVYKCIHGLAPDYLRNEVVLLSEISTNVTRQHPLTVALPLPEKDMSKRKFSYIGGKTWNSLPNEIKNCRSLGMFKLKLKHYIKSRTTD